MKQSGETDIFYNLDNLSFAPFKVVGSWPSAGDKISLLNTVGDAILKLTPRLRQAVRQEFDLPKVCQKTGKAPYRKSFLRTDDAASWF